MDKWNTFNFRNRGLRALTVLATVAAIGISSLGIAESPVATAHRSKYGFEVMSFKDGSTITRGMMLGFRSVDYFPNSDFNYGFSVYAGSPYGGRLSNDNLTYGGFVLGNDGVINRFLAYDFSIVAGYGFANVSNLGLASNGIAIQPSVGLGIAVLDGYRATFTAGYLYMNSMPGTSGITFGIRLDRKTFSSVKGLDN